MTQNTLQVQFINPPGLFSPPGFTHVVDINGGQTIYIAGQVAFDSSFQLVGQGDFQTQAQQVFENLKTALASVGADFNHMVKINIYLVDMTKLPIITDVRDRYVNPQHPPASTAIEVRKLAREGLLLEVDGIACIPS